MSIKGFHFQKFGRRWNVPLQIFNVNGHLSLIKCVLPTYNDLKQEMTAKKLQPFLLVCQSLDWHPSQCPLKLLWAPFPSRMSLLLRRYWKLVNNWEAVLIQGFVQRISILEMNLAVSQENSFSTWFAINKLNSEE